MEKQKPIDVKALSKLAQNSKEKEVYVQLEKKRFCRIGVGARKNAPTSTSFFMEVIVNLSADDSQVDLMHLENALTCLKALKARGYALTYEGEACISCETTSAVQNPNEEFRAIKALIKEAQI